MLSIANISLAICAVALLELRRRRCFGVALDTHTHAQLLLPILI